MLLSLLLSFKTRGKTEKQSEKVTLMLLLDRLCPIDGPVGRTTRLKPTFSSPEERFPEREGHSGKFEGERARHGRRADQVVVVKVTVGGERGKRGGLGWRSLLFHHHEQSKLKTKTQI